jgi:hypothetical protein
VHKRNLSRVQQRHAIYGVILCPSYIEFDG